MVLHKINLLKIGTVKELGSLLFPAVLHFHLPHNQFLDISMCSSKSTSSIPNIHLSRVTTDLLDYVLPALAPHSNMHLRILLRWLIAQPHRSGVDRLYLAICQLHHSFRRPIQEGPSHRGSLRS